MQPRTEEEKLEHYKQILKNQKKMIGEPTNNHVDKSKSVMNIKKVEENTFPNPKMDKGFKVVFKPLSTVAQKLDMFISKF